MSYPAPAVQVLVLLIVLLAAFWDLRVRRIPNWLTLSGVILGFGLNGFLYGSSGLLLSSRGFALGLVIYLGLYLIRAMGAGDAKLMAAVGATVGAADWIGIFICTGIVGGIVALLLLAYRRRIRGTLWNVGFLAGELLKFRAPYVQREELDVKSPKAVTLPHGAVIAVGTIAFLIAAHIWAPR
jgi:prepilin peptidase CpaA